MLKELVYIPNPYWADFPLLVEHLRATAVDAGIRVVETVFFELQYSAAL